MITLFHISLVASFALFVVPKGRKYALTLLLELLLVAASTTWAVQAFTTNEVLTVPLGISSWSGPVVLVVDKLSAFFILTVNFICLMGMLYAGGYLRPYITKKRAVTISLHLFSLLWLNAAMILVCTLRDGLAFLLGWELLSLTSFVLVIFEGEKELTLKTGINYLLQMHFGFAMIMFGFLVVNVTTGSMTFDALQIYFQDNDNIGLFLLFFTGFGIKAGFIPLHTWLPRAHPAAPSHVSAVMSGVMIKMGIYGILRVTSFVQHDFEAIGIVVLIISMVSGVLGVVLAVMQHDLKRLLAYHSIENIGIIGIGIGISLLGMELQDSFLITLGMAGALLHTLNHALFKSLLFFSTGNVFYATHSVNMDQLGGLAKQMRLTSMAFLLGALAISGIPPFNGFISEFLIYQGIMAGLTQANFSMSLAMLSAFISLVVIGGLCTYCFTKAFGLTFLGTRRLTTSPPVQRVPLIMILPIAAILVVILLIGFVPAIVVKPLESVLTLFPNIPDISHPMSASLDSLTAIGAVNAMLVSTVAILTAVRLYQQSKVIVETGPTWGCGYSAGDFRHQYTPTSYADSLLQLAKPVIVFKRDFESIPESEVFPGKRVFHTETGDRVEQSTVTRLIGLLVKYLPLAGRPQTGLIPHYLIYPIAFLLIIGLLTYLNYL